MDTNDTLIPTRQSLLSRLRDWNDHPSWQDFFNTYWKLIYNTALGAGLNGLEAEEVAQETLISISKSIRDFKYNPQRGSFKSWLRTTTIWRIRDHLRKRNRARTESLDSNERWSELAELQDESQDPITRNWDQAWEQNLANAALERTRNKVSLKHFQIFDLAVMKQWPADKIAKALQVNSGYVYLIKHRVSARLKQELKKLRRDPLETNDPATMPDAATLARPPLGVVEATSLAIHTELNENPTPFQHPQIQPETC